MSNEGSSENTLKGIVKAVRIKLTTFIEYTSSVFEDKIKLVELTRFETDEHVIRTVTRTKMALESTDDKRVV